MTPVRAVLFALLFGAAARAADPDAVAFNFQDVEIGVVARFVSEVTGRNLILDDRVRGKVSIFSPTRISPAEAVAAKLREE
jgi:general secretion pathway protein D